MTAILETAFCTLKNVDRAKSQYEFSKNWCGKSRSYLSWLKAAKAKPSIESLTTLLFRIGAEISRLTLSPDEEFPDVTEHDLEELGGLRDMIAAELQRICIS